MPALPPDPTAAGRTVNPARTRLESPLAAAMRGRVYHLRRQPPPRQRGRQVLAIVGTLLVHVFFLFGFVLGAAFQPALPPPHTEQALQVRLIEPPEPPPPPAVRGTPPKERGPRHQGQRRPPAAHHEPGANTAARTANAPATPPSPVIPTASQAPAPPPQSMVDTSPAASPPASAPLPLPRAVAPPANRRHWWCRYRPRCHRCPRHSSPSQCARHRSKATARSCHPRRWPCPRWSSPRQPTCRSWRYIWMCRKRLHPPA